MKISQEVRSQIDATRKAVQNTVGGRHSFNGMIESHSVALKQQEIKKLMDDIQAQGDKLAKFRSFRDLAKFKRMIKDFLQETVYNGLDLQHKQSFSLDGKNRKLFIVKEVDEKLIKLTEELMHHESKTVDLLGIIGEIKGLLINLYT